MQDYMWLLKNINQYMKKLFIVLLAFSIGPFALAQETVKKPKVPVGGRPNIPADLVVEFGFNVLNNRPEDMSTGFLDPERSIFTTNIRFQYSVLIPVSL